MRRRSFVCGHHKEGRFPGILRGRNGMNPAISYGIIVRILTNLPIVHSLIGVLWLASRILPLPLSCMIPPTRWIVPAGLGVVTFCKI